MATANLDELNRLAFEHCIFPLAEMDDVRRDGPEHLCQGRGRRTHRQERPHLSRHDEFAHARQFARLRLRGNRQGRLRPASRAPLCRHGGQLRRAGRALWPPSSRELAPGQLSNVMYVSGGSEAVEAALKLAKQYHFIAAASRGPTRSSRAGTPITARRWARSRSPTGSAPATSPSPACRARA